MADMTDLAKQLLDVLEGYNTWEANMLMDMEAWKRDMAEYPTLTPRLWDELLELQGKRNEAVEAARQALGLKEAP